MTGLDHVPGLRVHRSLDGADPEHLLIVDTDQLANGAIAQIEGLHRELFQRVYLDKRESGRSCQYERIPICLCDRRGGSHVLKVSQGLLSGLTL